MATEFTLATGQLEPKDKGGARAGIGCKGLAKRVGDGAITIQIFRGDGGAPEAYPTELRSRSIAARDGRVHPIFLATIDFDDNFGQRGYQMRVTADGADIGVTEALIAPEPYATAGIG